MKARILAVMLLAALSAVGCHPKKPFGPGGGPGGAAGHLDSHNLPPAHQLMHPGPGVGGPGPGVMMPSSPMVGPGGAPVGPTMSSVQVLFASRIGMRVHQVTEAGTFDNEQFKIVPFKENVRPGVVMRMKLTSIPGYDAVELYPTLEIGPVTPQSIAFLAHNAIPVQFTPEDFDQVQSGNFVTKVIYLPDPEFQELAVAGDVGVLVSTRLDPGQNPITEADRRGTILAILRIGNKDLGVPSADGQVEVVPSHYMSQSAVRQMQHEGHLPGGPNGFGPTIPLVPSHVAGITAPMYGMPMTGTPIGLPGPAHIPLGVPAGLRRHSITDHTHKHIPGASPALDVHVKQHPGLSYPKPATKAHIYQENFHPAPHFQQPPYDKYQKVPSGVPGH